MRSTSGEGVPGCTPARRSPCSGSTALSGGSIRVSPTRAGPTRRRCSTSGPSRDRACDRFGTLYAALGSDPERAALLLEGFGSRARHSSRPLLRAGVDLLVRGGRAGLGQRLESFLVPHLLLLVLRV